METFSDDNMEAAFMPLHHPAEIRGEHVAEPTRPDAGVARKLAISAAVGAFTYLATVISKQPQIWSLTMSIFIGGVSLVVQMLIDFDRRLTYVDQRQQDQFRNISRSTELFG